MDDGFKLMEDIRVDKTMVDGKATFKTINIKETSSHNAKSLVPGGKLLDLLSDNTRSRDASNFTYHFQNCTALTTQCSATFSVSNMSAAAPLTHSAASGSIITSWV
jgi:hypothetical protein